jgi:hypothetical protein
VGQTELKRVGQTELKKVGQTELKWVGQSHRNFHNSRHMEVWPTDTHIMFENGYNVPLVFGEGNKKFRFELRKPEYTMNGTDLRVTI